MALSYWFSLCLRGRTARGGSCFRHGGKGSGGEGKENNLATSSGSIFIDLSTLEAATGNFCEANLLGRGGFGPVYKGVMTNGQEVAVKQLSIDSRQGAREFTNEVTLLLKVQHRNLVSLLGCCVATGRKMLVYPFFPNRSLDYILFGIGISELDMVSDFYRRVYNEYFD